MLPLVKGRSRRNSSSSTSRTATATGTRPSCGRKPKASSGPIRVKPSPSANSTRSSTSNSDKIRCMPWLRRTVPSRAAAARAMFGGVARSAGRASVGSRASATPTTGLSSASSPLSLGTRSFWNLCPLRLGPVLRYGAQFFIAKRSERNENLFSFPSGVQDIWIFIYRATIMRGSR